MLIEQAAYANRWRLVTPSAKALFAGAGLLAAFSASSPMVAAGIALLLVLVTLVGAGVPLALYGRVAAPPLGFLALSGLSLLVSVGVGPDGGLLLQPAPDGWPRIAAVTARSLAALAALLGLVLTTPMPDLIGLLRRCRVPSTLLDMMVLCYRMLFVFSEALSDTLTAQKARLGYSSHRRSLRSLGLVAASLALQIWERARALQLAAEARNSDGALRLLAPDFVHAGRDTAIAGLFGSLMVMAALGLVA